MWTFGFSSWFENFKPFYLSNFFAREKIARTSVQRFLYSQSYFLLVGEVDDLHGFNLHCVEQGVHWIGIFRVVG